MRTRQHEKARETPVLTHITGVFASLLRFALLPSIYAPEKRHFGASGLWTFGPKSSLGERGSLAPTSRFGCDTIRHVVLYYLRIRLQIERFFMPPQHIIDPSTLDVNNIISTRDDIYALLPHRYEFERLMGTIYEDRETVTMAGYYDLPETDFWVRGHIPGRPLFPGVMMIETAAQLVSYLCLKYSDDSTNSGFLGFSAVDGVKFRGSVTHGQKLVITGRLEDIRPRRIRGYTQGFVDGKMVYEGMITGMWL